MQSWSIEDQAPDSLDDLMKVELLASYGVYAVLSRHDGNNYRAVLKEARKEAYMASALMFGFYMDRPQNRIGSTGWDTIQGNLLAGLDRLNQA